METTRWQHCVVAAAALLLLASGLTSAGRLDLSMSFGPMAGAIVVATALVIFATLALVLRLDWNGYATLAIVAWLLAAFSLLRAAHTLMPVLLLGLIALALCSGLLLRAPSSWHGRDGDRF